jgi:hypothetical protein
MFAVALAGLALGACSNATEDATAPSTSEAELSGVNPLNFWKSTSNLFFDVTGGGTPAAQVVEVGGIVVTTTPYVRVLGITYSPSNVKDWLRITQRPGLLEDGTLGVRLTFTVRQVPGLDLGATATVPITVPGARNGPQTITVTTNPLNCAVASQIPYPTPIGATSYVLGDLQVGDCTAPALLGSKFFDLYSVLVPADRSFRLDNRGAPSGAGTHTDLYIYLYDPMTGTIIASDDDGGAGFDSRLFWSNTSGSPKLYYLISSQYCCGQSGTYTFEVTDLGSASTSAPMLMLPEPETPAEIAKKRAARQ